jgi:hypothetical protein
MKTLQGGGKVNTKRRVEESRGEGEGEGEGEGRGEREENG